ncbi:MAG: N-acetylmuramoyl-L-alanine amidase [wastewater metagenome]|nr:N-acetylmuramoyl-L-alanine amidase [Candidatus Loosdrechtia aerotolerans]
MYFQRKRSVWLLFFIMFYVYGCSTSPTFKPVTPPQQTPLKKAKPHICSQLDRYYVRDWKYIVIHHSATSSGSAASFDKSHRNKGWENGLGYHFVIGNGNGSADGQIEIGNRWVNQIDGAHAGVKEYNHYGIGVCLVGNFNESHPTPAQMNSLSVLIEYLQERCNISSANIITHKYFRDTECPGKNFPYYKVLARGVRW